MSAQVHSSRVSYDGSDRFDVTRLHCVTLRDVEGMMNTEQAMVAIADDRGAVAGARWAAKHHDYSATIEYLPGQGAAIVALFDHGGEWSGAGRVEVRSGRRSDLYESGYRLASFSAHIKGGRLARFSVVS